MSNFSVAHALPEAGPGYTKCARRAALKSSSIRVLAFLEAHSITGPAKVIVELARESMRQDDAAPPLEIVIATFLRGVAENSFTRAIL